MKLHSSKCYKKCTSQESEVRHESPVSFPELLPEVTETRITAKEITFPAKAVVQQTMKRWIDSIKPKEKSELDMKIARFIYGANLPFRTVENPLFQDLMNSTKPSYELPSAFIIGGSLLDKVYEEVMLNYKNKLNGKKVTILQDGWSTNQNSCVISHCLHTGEESFYLDAVETKTESKTAVFCLSLLEKAITKAEWFGCKVIGLGTDNTESMNAMRRECGAKYPDINVYGCHSHIFNLLGQDLTPTIMVDNIVAVQKFFRSHHFESAALKERGGSRPIIPGATRWNSQLDCLRSFQNNQTKYIEISRLKSSSLHKNKEIMATLTDPTIFEKIESALEILKPITAALDLCQTETASLSDAIYHWIELSRNLQLTGKPLKHFIKRQNMGMSGVAIAAYMLHPLYRGARLSNEQALLGYTFLEKHSPFFVAAAMYLKASDTKFYPEHLLNKEIVQHLTPAMWWRSLENYDSISPSLINFAENLMLLPASTAALERCFSTMSNILTVRRNRLGLNKVKKLCTVYKSLVRQDEYLDDGEAAKDSDICEKEFFSRN